MFGSGPNEPDEPFGDAYGEPEPEENPFPEYGEPSVDELTSDLPDESEVDSELFRAFWGLVATLNLGLFAFSVGLMMVGFRGQYRQGGAVTLLGAVALAYAAYEYRKVRRERADGSDGD